MIDHKVIPNTDAKTTIKIRYKHPFTGLPAEYDLRCSLTQYLEGVFDYRQGMMMQNAFNFLPQEDRELLICGLQPHEWDDVMGPEEEDA